MTPRQLPKVTKVAFQVLPQQEPYEGRKKIAQLKIFYTKLRAQVSDKAVFLQENADIGRYVAN